jgi:rhamnosyltransferase
MHLPLSPLTSPRVAVVIPTLNPGRYASAVARALSQQTLEHDLVIVDSESDWPEYLRPLLVRAVHYGTVSRSSFGHGVTRNHAARITDAEVLVFLSQDAVPEHPEWLEALVAPLVRGEAAAAFSRQVAREEANPLERFARERNYPLESRTVGSGDVARLGIRAFFFSNAASAVRRDAFDALGGFPTHTVMNEDMLFAARALAAGHAVAYVSASVVTHSHQYGPIDTFRRYFDIGTVLDVARDELGGVRASGEGARYFVDLVRALKEQPKPYVWIPLAVAETAAKLSGVTLGRVHRRLPRALVRRLSLHPRQWRDHSGSAPS